MEWGLTSRYIVEHLLLFHCPFVEYLGRDEFRCEVNAFAFRLIQHGRETVPSQTQNRERLPSNLMFAAFKDDFFHK